MYKGQTENYKLIKYLNKDTIKVVLGRARQNKRNYLILLILWRTDVRAEELTNLKKGDIKPDELIVRKGKGN